MDGINGTERGAAEPQREIEAKSAERERAPDEIPVRTGTSRAKVETPWKPDDWAMI